MSVSTQTNFSDLLQQLSESRIGREIRSHHKGIDEKTNQRFRLTTDSIGDGRAHANPVLRAIAEEQRLEGGEDDHKKRHPLAITERHQPAAKVLWQSETQLGSVRSLHRRSRPIGGK